MHRILLTGSNGLLGQKLVHLLRERNDVRLLATSSGDNRITVKSGYEYQTMDITDANQVDKVVSTFKPTAIINTAAMTMVDACETEQEKCYAINLDGVKHLLNSAEKTQAKLIHLSTDFVFNGEAGPYQEEDVPDPLSVYAKSKYESEQLLLNAEYKNWAIARTIIVYGIAENMSRSNIILWARKALKAGDKMTIVDDQFRSPTLAEDLAMGCWLIAEKNETGIYHLSGPTVYSIIDLVRAVAAHYSVDDSNVVPIKSETLNQAAKRPPRTGFILDKARNDLGYAPRSIEEGLALIDQQDPLDSL
jgi:dTDP-4-dehydrorhamnose reductase